MRQPLLCLAWQAWQDLAPSPEHLSMRKAFLRNHRGRRLCSSPSSCWRQVEPHPCCRTPGPTGSLAMFPAVLLCCRARIETMHSTFLRVSGNSVPYRIEKLNQLHRVTGPEGNSKVPPKPFLTRVGNIHGRLIFLHQVEPPPNTPAPVSRPRWSHEDIILLRHPVLFEEILEAIVRNEIIWLELCLAHQLHTILPNGIFSLSQAKKVEGLTGFQASAKEIPHFHRLVT